MEAMSEGPTVPQWAAEALLDCPQGTVLKSGVGGRCRGRLPRPNFMGPSVGQGRKVRQLSWRPHQGGDSPGKQQDWPVPGRGSGAGRRLRLTAARERVGLQH